MKRVRRGFTLIEVSLFLVITAAVFVGVAVGTQNSIFQQRYNDAVQNYVEFLRTVYSQVTNVQNENTGRSGKAIYGKLVTFNKSENGENEIKTYNVIGNLESSTAVSGSQVLEKLASLDANVLIENEEEDGNKNWEPVGFVESYMPRWASQIQTEKEWGVNGTDGYQIFEGALLIVRSPSSGTVYTYVANKRIDVDDVIDDDYLSVKNPFKYVEDGNDRSYLTDGSFEAKDVDFCVNPNGPDRSRLRRDVRIIANARNASGIEIVPDDEEWVGVGENRVNIGNKCEY